MGVQKGNDGKEDCVLVPMTINREEVRSPKFLLPSYKYGSLVALLSWFIYQWLPMITQWC